MNKICINKKYLYLFLIAFILIIYSVLIYKISQSKNNQIKTNAAENQVMIIGKLDLISPNQLSEIGVGLEKKVNNSWVALRQYRIGSPKNGNSYLYKMTKEQTSNWGNNEKGPLLDTSAQYRVSAYAIGTGGLTFVGEQYVTKCSGTIDKYIANSQKCILKAPGGADFKIYGDSLILKSTTATVKLAAINDEISSLGVGIEKKGVNGGWDPVETHTSKSPKNGNVYSFNFNQRIIDKSSEYRINAFIIFNGRFIGYQYATFCSGTIDKIEGKDHQKCSFKGNGSVNFVVSDIPVSVTP